MKRTMKYKSETNGFTVISNDRELTSNLAKDLSKINRSNIYGKPYQNETIGEFNKFADMELEMNKPHPVTKEAKRYIQEVDKYEVSTILVVLGLIGVLALVFANYVVISLFNL